MVLWTDEEIILAVVFDMWGIRQEVIAQMLTNRRATLQGVQGPVAGLPAAPIPEYRRSLSAVKNKLHDARELYPRLLAGNNWHFDAVYAHIHRSPNETLIHQLMVFSDEELRLILQV